MTLNLNRRSLLKAGGAGLVYATAVTPTWAAGPKKGGTLRMGIKGGNTSDSFDGRTHTDSFMINMAHGCVFDCMTEIAADGSLKGELGRKLGSLCRRENLDVQPAQGCRPSTMARILHSR